MRRRSNNSFSLHHIINYKTESDVVCDTNDCADRLFSEEGERRKKERKNHIYLDTFLFKKVYVHLLVCHHHHHYYYCFIKATIALETSGLLNSSSFIASSLRFLPGFSSM